MAALDRVVSLSQVLEGENDSAPPDRAPEAEAKKKSPDSREPLTPPASGASDATAENRSPPEASSPASEESGSPPPSASLSGVELELRWPKIVEKFSEARPFAAGPLLQSRVAVLPGDPVAVSVTFSGPGARELFLADGDNKKALRDFLASLLGRETSFVLEFAASAAPDPVRIDSPPHGNGQAWIENEPIVKTLVEMFEGRVLDVSS
jgi:hypothetical protein